MTAGADELRLAEEELQSIDRLAERSAASGRRSFTRERHR
jgi:hypothetical protein